MLSALFLHYVGDNFCVKACHIQLFAAVRLYRYISVINSRQNRMQFLLLLFLFSIAKGEFAEDASPKVQTHLGGIEGSVKKSYSGRTYAAYEGIPYALPPILDRRFQVISLQFYNHFIIFL